MENRLLDHSVFNIHHTDFYGQICIEQFKGLCRKKHADQSFYD